MIERNARMNEYLNAFVDDELAPEEEQQIAALINQDESLQRHVCELRWVSNLMRLAYQETSNNE